MAATAWLILEDLTIAARTVWGEARGEDYQGQLAVAHVFINRWHTSKGQFRKDDTLATSCLRHAQFTAWTAGDPNFVKMMKVDFNDYHLRRCLIIVLEAIDAEFDPTKGALHYHTRDILPPWARGHVPCYETGRHLFYNDVK